MGYLVATGASRTEEKLRANLRCSRGVSFSWDAGGQRYFLDFTRKERKDWAVTGTVSREVPGSRTPDGCFLARKVGSFRIEADGKITRGPQAMKAAAGQ
jgi:hypothetical protein